MSTDLALPQAPGQLAERVHLYAVGANARNTLRAYQADLRDYTAWCDLQGVQALPALPLTVAAYLTSLADAGAAVATIERRMAALSQAHQAIGTTPPPTSDWNVRQVMKGIRRRLAGAPAQRRELLGPELRRLCETLPDGRLGLRDRALLLMGHLGALRRSELVALNVEDVEVTDDGLVVSLRRSKTDQEGEGAVVGIPRRRRDPEVCPVRALRAWLEDAGHTSGPLWRPVNRWGQVAPRRITDKTVARIVKRSCVRAGLDPARYSAHSLRSGFATEASRGGATEQEIMTHGRWRSVEVARRYIRRGTLFNRNPADAVAL